MTRRLLPLFIIWMTFLGGNFIPYHIALPLRVAHHIILSALLLYTLKDFKFSTSPLTPGIALMSAALLISNLTAVDHRMALEYSWHWITNMLLMLLCIRWVKQGYGGQLLRWQFAAGGLLALSVIGEYVITGERSAGLMFIINLAGAYMAALVVPLFAWGETTLSDRGKWISFIIIVLLVLAIGVNGSRGAILSVAIAFAVYVVLEVGWSGVIRAGIILFMGALFIVGRSQQPNHANGDIARLGLWDAAYQMIDDYPFGVGPGLFPQVYRELSPNIDEKASGAHNHYLNLAAEMGGLGIAAGGVMLLLLIYALTQQWAVGLHSRHKAVLAALVGIAAHLMVDNYPAQNWSFLIATYTALLVGMIKLDLPFPALDRVGRIGFRVVILYFAIFHVGSDLAQYHYERFLGGDRAALQTAIALDPNLRLYRMMANEELPGNSSTQLFAMTNFARLSK